MFFVCLSINLSVYRSIYLLLCPSICLSVCLSVDLSLFFSTFFRIYFFLSFLLSFFPSFFLSSFLSLFVKTWHGKMDRKKDNGNFGVASKVLKTDCLILQCRPAWSKSNLPWAKLCSFDLSHDSPVHLCAMHFCNALQTFAHSRWNCLHLCRCNCTHCQGTGSQPPADLHTQCTAYHVPGSEKRPKEYTPAQTQTASECSFALDVLH